MAHTCWWYYFSKFTEFADTLFFVLRKKNEHVSTLHVIHHGIMPMSVWFGMKFAPGSYNFSITKGSTSWYNVIAILRSSFGKYLCHLSLDFSRPNIYQIKQIPCTKWSATREYVVGTVRGQQSMRYYYSCDEALKGERKRRLSLACAPHSTDHIKGTCNTWT